MNSLGIIGSGNIGAAIARLVVAAEIPVVIANSRGPESLAGLVTELGALASAGTIEQAAAQDHVVLSVPLSAHQSIPAAILHGKTVLDTSNYYPSRDGRIAELDSNVVTTSELVQRHFEGVDIVKAFRATSWLITSLSWLAPQGLLIGQLFPWPATIAVHRAKRLL